MSKKKLIGLINKAGGKVIDDLFVVKPGVQLLEVSKSTPFAKDLYESLNFDNSEDYLQSAEFKGRVTYLSFKNQKGFSNDFHQKMIKDLKHLSIYSGFDVTFLIAGCSIETSLEFIAHHESRVARLTSSKTKAMNDTLFRVQSPGQELQMNFIKEFLQLREKYSKYISEDPKETNLLNTEEFNMLNLCKKATALTYSMNIKDIHKMFIGRLTEGNESEVQEICIEMCRQLNQEYPEFFDKPEKYIENGKRKDNNGEKLNIN